MFKLALLISHFFIVASYADFEFTATIDPMRMGPSSEGLEIEENLKMHLQSLGCEKKDKLPPSVICSPRDGLPEKFKIGSVFAHVCKVYSNNCFRVGMAEACEKKQKKIHIGKWGDEDLMICQGKPAKIQPDKNNESTRIIPKSNWKPPVEEQSNPANAAI